MSRKTEQSVGKMEKAFNGLNRGLATLGVGLSLAGMAAFAKASVDAIARLDDLSEKTSLAVETLSQLREVTIIGGHSLDEVAVAAGRFGKSVSAAAGGNKELLGFFKQMGISADDLRSKNLDELFVKFAVTIANAKDQNNALSVAAKLAGKSVAEMAPFFQDLAERGLSAAKVTKEMAAEAERVQKNFKELALSTSQARDGLVGNLLPGLIRVSEVMKQSIKDGDNLLVVMAKIAKATFFGDAQLREDKAFSDAVNDGLRIERELGEVRKKADAALFVTDARRESFAKNETLRLEKELHANKLLTQVLQIQRKAREVAAPTAPTRPEGITVGPVRDQAGLDKAKRDAEAAAAAFADLAVAQGKIVSDVEKNLAKERLSVLERFYSQGLIGEANYWESRASIQQTAYDVEKRVLDQNIKTRQAEADSIAADKTRGTKSKDYADALRALGAAQAERNKLDQDFNSQGLSGWLDKVKAAKDYEKEIRGVNIQLLEMAGKTAEAAAAQFDLQNEGLARRVRETGSVGDERAYEKLRASIVVQKEFNDLRTQASQVTDSLAIEEERIQNSRRVGAISEFTAMQRLDAGRQRAVQTLRLTVVELENVANAARLKGTEGFQNLVLDAERARVALETLEGSANSLADKFNTTISDSFADAFGDFITGTKKASEAFKSFSNAVINEMARMYAKQLASSLMGGGAGGGGLGIGGLLADLWKGLWGGGSGGGTSATPYYGEAAVGIQNVPQDGLAFLHKGEQVVPADQVGRGPSITNIYNIDSRSDRAEIGAAIRQSEQRTIAQVADMTRRGGGYSKAVRG